MGEPEGEDPLLAEGTRVGDFQIRGFLGEGAMGQVYLAQDLLLDRRIALKFIKRSVMRSEGIERFMEEARTTASFNHPHIVTLHAIGEHEGRPYLALEYLDGESLRARLAAGPLPTREALRHGRAVADAIAEAHRRGLVHADLKPENIVVPRDGRVRVVDFGVAKLVGGATNAASGTPAYMAPERWHGVPPTGAIDVWAFGITLHELIAGRHPIAGAALLHLAFAVDVLELPDLPPAPWARLVRDCLTIDPAARPTAEELVRRLDRLIDPRPAAEDITGEPTAAEGALSMYAPHGITQPAASEARLVRGVLLALADPDETGRPWLRGALLAGVPVGAREALDRLIDRLVDRGVVVATRDIERDGAMLEIDHEALASAWPQLARWLDETYAHRFRAALSGRAAAPASSPWSASLLGGLEETGRADGVDEPGHAERAGPPAQGTAPRAGGSRSPAITGSERPLLSVVLLGGAAADEERAAASEAADEGADEDADEDALQRGILQAIQPYGGRLERLADATAIVVLEASQQVATDQAAQAARCALAMRAAVGARPMAIAMGRVDSTAELPGGGVIERASRLLARRAAPQGAPLAIVLDEMCAGLLDARFDVIEGDAGLELCGERALMQGARTLLGRPTSCVGRDWELGALTGILDECIDERGARAVVVTAPAGMGKSRLGAELVSRVQERGERVAIWVGRGDSLRAGSTLDLLAQALRGALGIHGGEPLAERRDRIRTRVAEHVPAAARHRVAEFLGELVGAPFPGDDEGSPQLKAARQDAQLMSEQMRKAWLDFLQAEAAAHPILLLLEDLHWGDFGTVRFIDAALRDRGELPWMVLALARPEIAEVFPRLWADRQHVQEIRLKELGRRAGERLVRQVLGDSVDPETIDRMVQQAEGNAFYLEELIRAVAEGKDQALPETVLAMVQTRLARLPLEARRVLRAASVFGEVCWESGVTVLLGGAMGAAAVSQQLSRLVEQEVLTVRSESRIAGAHELKFRHALLREGAYATLTERDRRLGHRLAGEWLEQHGEADPMVLAGHFERGDDRARAASYYLRASRQALLVLDLDATVACAGLGLRCAPPEEIRLALLGMRCDAATQGLHLVAAVMPDAEELLRSAPQGSVPWAQAIQAYYAGLLLAGRISDLLASVALLPEVDPTAEAAGRMALVLLNGLWNFDNLGRIAEGTALEERFFTVARGAGDREPVVRFWWLVAIGMRAAYAHEDPWKGLQHSDAVQPIFDATGHEVMLLNMQLFRGMNLWYLGAAGQAEALLEEIVAADETLGPVSSLRRFGLTWIRAERGALDEARALATRLCEDGRAHQNPLEEGRGRWALAEVLRRAGALDAAEREIRAALEMVVALEQPGALTTLALIHLAQGRAEAALAVAEDAAARCAAMGGCGLFRGAFVRLAHAEALHAAGAADAAARAIAEARARLLAAAERIADPAYRRSFLEQVPESVRTLALARAWLGEPAPDG